MANIKGIAPATGLSVTTVSRHLNSYPLRNTVPATAGRLPPNSSKRPVDRRFGDSVRDRAVHPRGSPHAARFDAIPQLPLQNCPKPDEKYIVE